MYYLSTSSFCQKLTNISWMKNYIDGTRAYGYRGIKRLLLFLNSDHRLRISVIIKEKITI